MKVLAGAMTQTLPTQMAIGLVGTLGAGKTTFVQRLAESLGLDPAQVTSPTFTLLNTYQGRIVAGPIRLHHLDVYRIADEDEFLELGVDELFDEPDAWVVIEWADRVDTMMPKNTLWLSIDLEDVDHAGDDLPTDRIVRLSTSDDEIAEALLVLKQQYEAAHPLS